MTNKELKNVFRQTSALMELHGENSFKTKSYTNAAFSIDRAPEQLSEMDRDDIASIKGIGKAIHEKILNLFDTGTFPLLDRLIEQTPPGILQVMQIKGLGPKKIKVLWGELGIETLGELLYACNENRLVALKGFGAKTQESVKQNIEYFLSNADKFHYATLEYEAGEILERAEKVKEIEKLEVTGDLRRQCNVLDQLEFVLQAKGATNKICKALDIEDAEEEGELIKGRSAGGAQVCFHLAAKKNFDEVLFETSTSGAHLKELKKLKGFKKFSGKEEAYYKSLGLNFIPPPQREGIGEVKFFKKNNDAELVTEKDIRGVVHAHSTYSDGKHSLKDMAKASQELGYEYLVISDHSKSAFYAGGLQAKDIEKQHAEIEKLNKKTEGFKIFKSIESDILNNGDLDYTDDILETFDLVIASVHSVLKMDEDRATKRLIKAIENPYTRILGHMTGRLLLSRPGYPVDHKKVIDACATNGVSIEVNANPYRLDIDWRWLPYCQEKGVLISINPDAHSVEGIEDIRFGVISARKGRLTADNTLNSKGLDDFSNWLNIK